MRMNAAEASDPLLPTGRRKAPPPTPPGPPPRAPAQARTLRLEGAELGGSLRVPVLGGLQPVALVARVSAELGAPGRVVLAVQQGRTVLADGQQPVILCHLQIAAPLGHQRRVL